MSILELMKERIIFADGAIGSILLENGLKTGEIPEDWNVLHAELIEGIHYNYLKAGSDFVLANTFGANHFKLKGSRYCIKEIICNAVNNARKATAKANKELGKQCYVALDVGPTGKLIQPMGDVTFDEVYEAFKEQILLGVDAGVDFILIETMSDIYELKAAVLAAKENSNLPVFASVVFDNKGKLLTGADVKSVIALLEGLRVDVIGVNCGQGPIQFMPIVEELLKYSSTPLMIMPNAGLPHVRDGKTFYDIAPKEFASYVQKMIEMGVRCVGGCCGTNHEHISETYALCKGIKPKDILEKDFTFVSSYTHAVELKLNDSIIIGERINPTGKKRFKQALRDNDIAYIVKEGILQQDNGANILDVNVGLPEIDEPKMMVDVVKELQSVSDLPLQLDTSSIHAMEKGLRYYNGKAMLNSVNGKQESMSSIFPLVKKYGGVVVGLTLDENGIPSSAEERVQIAKRIIDTAATYGIKKKDIVIDVLCMAVSSDANAANVTLEALERISKELKVNTVLGVSNISFGLPMREKITQTFYALALERGLSSAIINPNVPEMISIYKSYRALKGLDENCNQYIDFHTNRVMQSVGLTSKVIDTKDSKVAIQNDDNLVSSIKRGLKNESCFIVTKKLSDEKPIDIINKYLVPALDEVGRGFEKGTIFLPQLLMSAEAAKSAFEILKQSMKETGNEATKRGKVVIATVKGDIHDIGKNIVKVLLENYGFDVIDLGKDVPAEVVLEAVRRNQVKLVGLSALMTTTVVSMKETIELLNKEEPSCKIMVGGAVMTEEYAKQINADFYSPDAMGSVRYACSLDL